MLRLLQRYPLFAALLPAMIAVALLANVRFASTVWSGGHDGEIEDCGEELRADTERRQIRREIISTPAIRHREATQLRNFVPPAQLATYISIEPDLLRFSVRRLR